MKNFLPEPVQLVQQTFIGHMEGTALSPGGTSFQRRELTRERADCCPRRGTAGEEGRTGHVPASCGSAGWRTGEPVVGARVRTEPHASPGARRPPSRAGAFGGSPPGQGDSRGVPGRAPQQTQHCFFLTSAPPNVSPRRGGRGPPLGWACDICPGPLFLPRNILRQIPGIASLHP